MMTDFLYEPAIELGSLKAGDVVQVLDSQATVVGKTKVKRVGKLVVTTVCGRTWTKEHGEWVSEIRGNRPVSWPFPSIRKAIAAAWQSKAQHADH